jgi:hypothetical protein
MKPSRLVFPPLVFALVWTVCGGYGCSAKAPGFNGDDGGGNSGSGNSFNPQGDDGGEDGGNSPQNQIIILPDGGIQVVDPCPGGGQTTISGTIYDPAGKNPLYNVSAFVPSEPVSPLLAGPSCASCSSLYTGNPVAAGTSDATGHFVINNAPSGASVPLVIQVGKWRRQFVLKNIKACQDNPQPDKSLTMPNNHSVGDIPNIAVSTGGADTLECLLRRIGIDASEYVPGASTSGRIHIFQGSGAGGFTIPIMIPGLNLSSIGAPNTNPAGPSSSSALWDSDKDINAYDIVMLSCEGSPTSNMDIQTMWDYAKAGGRVFASHFHYAWFTPSGPFASYTPPVANWVTNSTGGGTNQGCISADIKQTLANGATFPKGVAMAQWLQNVHALGVTPPGAGCKATTPAGELAIVQPRHDADVGTANTPSTSWIVPDPSAGEEANASQYFSFNTPLGGGAEEQCGRVVYSDLHVGGASNDNPSQPVPAECSTADLSPQEKALEFMLFDLSSCVVPDTAAPPSAVVITR